MDKQEFLDKLRTALSGNVSAKLVEENVRYYEEYINSQIRLGFPEEQVLKSLGEPRLLAKSIIMANGGDNTTSSTTRDKDLYNTEYYADTQNANNLKVVKLPKWLTITIICLVIALVLFVITSVVSVILPIVVPVVFIYLLIKLFKDWLK